MPGHGAHICKSTFNPTFVPKTFYGRGGRGNYRPTDGYGRGFVLRSFIGFGRGFNGQFGTKGYCFQGNLVYPNLNPFGYRSTSMFSHLGASSSISPPAAFNCHNGVSDISARFANPSAPNLPSPEVIEDHFWYIDNGASAYVTNNSGILLNSHGYTGLEDCFLVMTKAYKSHTLDLFCLILILMNI